jgi:hypothetical protein
MIGLMRLPRTRDNFFEPRLVPLAARPRIAPTGASRGVEQNRLSRKQRRPLLPFFGSTQRRHPWLLDLEVTDLAKPAKQDHKQSI